MSEYEVVKLSEEEREALLALVTKGRAPARQIRRANILLQLHEGTPESVVARNVRAGRATVRRVRHRFVTEGLESALTERPRPGREPVLDGKGEAMLVALACTTPPEDREEWTMQLLADKLVQIGVVMGISDETVRRTLKKTTSSRG